jgi:hypothetical protein
MDFQNLMKQRPPLLNIMPGPIVLKAQAIQSRVIFKKRYMRPQKAPRIENA